MTADNADDGDGRSPGRSCTATVVHHCACASQPENLTNWTIGCDIGMERLGASRFSGQFELTGVTTTCTASIQAPAAMGSQLKLGGAAERVELGGGRHGGLLAFKDVAPLQLLVHRLQQLAVPAQPRASAAAAAAAKGWARNDACGDPRLTGAPAAQTHSMLKPHSSQCFWMAC